MKNKIFSKIIYGIIGLVGIAGCSIEPTYYSEVVPSTFYSNQQNVWQRFYRPFTHWRWYQTSNASKWDLQEFGTDEVCLPTRGSDWLNGGIYQGVHHHVFTPDLSDVYNGWSGFSMGVALSWDALQDINKYVDFKALKFPEGTKESMETQLQTLVASFYLEGLDLFGGVPLYTSTNSNLKPRSTAQETFNFIDSLLNISIPSLPVKTTLGAMENGSINRAAGAALKARLYFNAKSYIGKDMFQECADICQDIIDGKYGKYALATDWTSIFGFKNEICPEIIWSVPSQNAFLENDGLYSRWQHYNTYKYLGSIDQEKGNNGTCLVPSLEPNGTNYKDDPKYGYKLGGAYGKFNSADVRKQPYVYLGGGKYRGMFIVGKLVNPLDGGTCTGSREYKGKTLTMVDQVTYFKQLGTTAYPTVNDLPSTVATAEENSGVRLMKQSPMPNLADRLLRCNPDIPVIRLSEIYYMLAECKLRLKDPETAANLIETVRKRYFANGVDPNPVTKDNLDEYRMLDEWMEEFVGEGRRRTDLIRWGAYTTESWWDHTPDNNTNLNRYPVPTLIMSSNNLLEQNPGY